MYLHPRCCVFALTVRFAGILLIVLAPVVLVAVQGGDAAVHDAAQGGYSEHAAAGQHGNMPSVIVAAQAGVVGAGAVRAGASSGAGVHQASAAPAVIVTALGFWLVGAALASLILRSHVVRPLSVLLEVASSGAGSNHPEARTGGMPADFEAVRRAILASREAAEAREITLLRRHDALTLLASSDALTGIGNRRAFDAALACAWDAAETNDDSLALAIFDIDSFKRFNDCHGHLVGDACLHEIAQVLRHLRVRDGDVAARLGGEEFALLLRGTDLDGAVAVVERALAAIRGRAIPHPDGLGGIVTASAGVAACRPHPGLTSARLFAAADAALYVAKANGRDRLATGLVLSGPFSGALQIRRVS